MKTSKHLCIDCKYYISDYFPTDFGDMDINLCELFEDYLLLYTGAVLKRVSNAVEFFMDEDVPVIPEVGKEETE